MFSYRNAPWAVATTITPQTLRVDELVYSNLSGPFRTTARDGSQYTLTLVDDKSRITIVQTIQSKNQAPTALLSMTRSFEKTFNCRIAALQTNHGDPLGLQNSEFPEDLLLPNIADIMSRIISHMASNAIISSGSPRNLWHEAFYNAVYTKNRLPHIALQGKSPLEVAKPGVKAQVEIFFLRPFGDPVWAFDKYRAQTIEAIIGYSWSHGVCRMLTKDNKVILAKIHHPRVPESSFPFGENTTAVTSFDWPSRTPHDLPVTVSHSRTVLSLDAEATSFPFGENMTAKTKCEWPSIVCINGLHVGITLGCTRTHGIPFKYSFRTRLFSGLNKSA